MIILPKPLSDTMRNTLRLQHANLVAETVGDYMIDRYRQAARERGHQAVAAQLRKQGFPLGVARLILLGKN